MTTRHIPLEEVVRMTGGRVVGDASVRIRDVAPVHDAGPDHLALLADRRYVGAAAESRAAAFLVSEALDGDAPEDRPRIVVEDAHRALVPLLDRLHPPSEPPTGIHPTAVLGEGVSLGPGATIGAYAVIEKGVVLADDVRIGAHCLVGEGCRLGEAVRLHAHVVLYPRTVVGRRTEIHAGARIGIDGFGYARDGDSYRKIPQVGRVVIEDDVEIGANACIDRGSIGDTVVGAGTKIDNLVHIAHNVRVGEGCAFAAQVGVAGSTRIGRSVVLGGQAGLNGHIDIGEGARISGQAGVIGDVAEGDTVTGYPARDLRTYLRAAAHMLRLPELTGEVRSLREKIEALETSRGGDGADPHRED